MRVTLVNMPIRTDAPPNNVPLGIYYLGAMLRLSGRHPSYVDLNAYRPPVEKDDIPRFIRNDADVFFLSGLITTYSWQKSVAEYIRKISNAPIILGGGLASNIGEQLLDWIDADAICIGEGDFVAERIVKDATIGKLKRVYKNPVPDINVLPYPDWMNVERLETYIQNPVWGLGAKNSSSTPFSMKRSLNMIGSRGCPYGCRFCSKDATGGRNFRVRNADNILEEASFLVNHHKLDFIGFVDDNLGCDTSNFLELCRGLKKLNIKWGCHARFNTMDSKTLLQEASDSGLVYIGFGGESANKDVLAAMNKGNKPQQMARVIRLCREAGIHPNVTWMMGWPGETRGQLRDTCKFILKNCPENKSLFVATAYPGTPLYDEVEDRILDKFGTLEAYVRTLGDATLPVMNYSAMPDDEFGHVHTLVREGRLDAV